MNFKFLTLSIALGCIGQSLKAPNTENGDFSEELSDSQSNTEPSFDRAEEKIRLEAIARAKKSHDQAMARKKLIIHQSEEDAKRKEINAKELTERTKMERNFDKIKSEIMARDSSKEERKRRKAKDQKKVKERMRKAEEKERKRIAKAKTQTKRSEQDLEEMAAKAREVTRRNQENAAIAAQRAEWARYEADVRKVERNFEIANSRFNEAYFKFLDDSRRYDLRIHYKIQTYKGLSYTEEEIRQGIEEHIKNDYKYSFQGFRNSDEGKKQWALICKGMNPNPEYREPRKLSLQ